MRNRRTKSPDALARLFLDVTGELPDDASLLRIRRVSSTLNLRDNDALWSVIAMLEYYARLYEAMPERIRHASDGGFDAVRREAEAATDALMHQHRDALARCKATIQLAEEMIREHEAGYRTALAQLNEASITVLADRMANRVAGIASNRFVGAAALAARDQRERMDGAVGSFERAIAEATVRAEGGAERIERRFVRALRRLWAVAAILLGIFVGMAVLVGEHLR
ncbi:hypothetical protein R69746_05916 [Paraburkholderia aspalathi]|uniref:hypothetical protein n=1 Tax=Paraburkholderia aspalathi TaxID=1324617 RepID=UPI00190A088C|nr:hypothetical protein [Paraburkholderia aspalathi]MBK3841957.1 hypothetical protein [Paraburkholderia aspalathi]CAE6817721.1 hypothetical protein R69746_05916 [Paraburkholderia aspalathi]